MISVMLIDENERVRRQLAIRLERQPDIKVVGECAPGDDSVGKVVRLKPSLVLMEIKTGDQRGLETCRKLCQEMPDIPVLVLTSYFDEAERGRVFKAGAAAYLLKDLDSAALLEAVGQAADPLPTVGSASLRKSAS